MSIMINRPENWISLFPQPSVDGHKYHRGHAALLGVPELTGATRLAAEACSRIGAGLVSVLSDDAGDIYRMTLPADIMVKPLEALASPRVTVLLAGSGGLSQTTKNALLNAPPDLPKVLDAEAISLFGRLTARELVLTPHDGEFGRAFADLEGDRKSIAVAAAKRANAVLLLKGPETVIAAPDDRVVINTHASPYLAKAGTGDVLAGMITGLIAQGMPGFEAAAAAVWMHGHASLKIGPGLIAQDLIAALPDVLSDLLETPDGADRIIKEE
ncbi:MAG: NAD(P)H-hydrate dehydratase [Pseudomonadota bacterium]